MDSWDKLKAECAGCRACALWETRHNLVFGVGREDAEVMFIGEGPGEQEDLKGEPFGPMPRLMAVAEYVTKVHAICVECGNLAHHSHRIAGGTNLVQLGEKDSYRPLCRHCFNKAVKLLEEK